MVSVEATDTTEWPSDVTRAGAPLTCTKGPTVLASLVETCSMEESGEEVEPGGVIPVIWSAILPEYLIGRRQRSCTAPVAPIGLRKGTAVHHPEKP